MARILSSLSMIDAIKEKAPVRYGGFDRHRALQAPFGVQQWLIPRADRTIVTMIDELDSVKASSVTIS